MGKVGVRAVSRFPVRATGGPVVPFSELGAWRQDQGQRTGWQRVGGEVLEDTEKGPLQQSCTAARCLSLELRVRLCIQVLALFPLLVSPPAHHRTSLCLGVLASNRQGEGRLS